MRIFLAGATGVIGSRLVPLLVEAGHQVSGMTRTPAKAASLEAAGATAVVCDVFDVDTLAAAMAAARPDLVMHQLTDLPDDVDRIGDHEAGQVRIRREGTRILIAATTDVGATRFMAQSVAWELPGAVGAATRSLEEQVLAYPGVVLRYGQLHGPGTYHPAAPPPEPRVHIDEAARRTVALLDAEPGIVVVTDRA